MNSELLSTRVPSSLVPIALEVCKVTGLPRPLIVKVDERTDGQWVTPKWRRSSFVLVINCLQDGAKGKVRDTEMCSDSLGTRNFQHNAHSRIMAVLWAPFDAMTTHAPCGPGDCELLSALACAVECVSFPLICGPIISRAQNGLPRFARWVFQRRLPVQYRYMDLFNYKYGRLSQLLPLSYHVNWSHNFSGSLYIF